MGQRDACPDWYGHNWVRWHVPSRFKGQRCLLSESLPGSHKYQERPQALYGSGACDATITRL